MKHIKLSVVVLAVFLSMSCTSGIAKKEKAQDAKNAALLEKSVESTDQNFIKGKTLLEEENYEEALAAFEKSEYSEAIFYRAVILQNKGNPDEAEKLFRICVEKDILKTESYYNLGLIAFDRGNTPESEEFMDKVLEISPKHIPAMYFKGNLYFIETELDKALEYYNKALKIDPRKTELWDAVFAVKLQKEEYGECWKIRDKIELSNPMILSNILKIGQKLEHYEEALALIPEDLENELSIRQEKRIILTRTGKLKEAIDMANEDMDKKQELEYAVIDRGGANEDAYLLIQRKDGVLYLLCAKNQGRELALTIDEDMITVSGLSEGVPFTEISSFSMETCKN